MRSCAEHQVRGRPSSSTERTRACVHTRRPPPPVLSRAHCTCSPAGCARRAEAVLAQPTWSQLPPNFCCSGLLPLPLPLPGRTRPGSSEDDLDSWRLDHARSAAGGACSLSANDDSQPNRPTDGDGAKLEDAPAAAAHGGFLAPTPVVLQALGGFWRRGGQGVGSSLRRRVRAEGGRGPGLARAGSPQRSGATERKGATGGGGGGLRHDRFYNRGRG